MQITAEEVAAICDTLELKPAQVQAVRLRWELGLSYRAAAKAAGTTEDALRSQVKRLR